jgi:hypothetical protein
MKCCASQTISTVKPAPAPAPPPARDAREAAVAFEALLFQETLKPLSKSLGFFGDAATGACAQAIAREAHGGIIDRLAQLFATETPR